MDITKLTSPNNKKTLVILIIVAVAIVGILGVLIAGLAVRPTVMEIMLYDEASGEDVTEDGKAWLYRANISTLDVEEISDLTFADYEVVLEDKDADKVSEYLDHERYVYLLKVEYKGTTKWTIPEDGENMIFVIDQTEDMNIVMEDSTKNQTFTNNENTEYTAYVLTDSNEGFVPSYFYDNEYYNALWLRFNFSSDVDGNSTITAEESWIDIPNYGGDYVLNGSYVYVGLTATVIEEIELPIEFSSGKASDYYLVNIDVGIGDFDGDQDNLTLF